MDPIGKPSVCDNDFMDDLSKSIGECVLCSIECYDIVKTNCCRQELCNSCFIRNLDLCPFCRMNPVGGEVKMKNMLMLKRFIQSNEKLRDDAYELYCKTQNFFKDAIGQIEANAQVCNVLSNSMVQSERNTDTSKIIDQVFKDSRFTWKMLNLISTNRPNIPNPRNRYYREYQRRHQDAGYRFTATIPANSFISPIRSIERTRPPSIIRNRRNLDEVLRPAIRAMDRTSTEALQAIRNNRQLTRQDATVGLNQVVDLTVESTSTNSLMSSSPLNYIEEEDISEQPVHVFETGNISYIDSEGESDFIEGPRVSMNYLDDEEE